MEMNFYICLITALIPMIIGAVWYGPLFGKTWMNLMGFTEDSLKDTNMVKVLSVCYLLSVCIGLALMPMVIHQMGTYSTLAAEPGFLEQTGDAFAYFEKFKSTYGDRFRTFKHGAFHGLLYGGLLVTPILGIIALFEKKSFKYVAINAGYWMITLALMGGVISKWV